MLLEHYEEIIKELEELEINLDNLSNKEIHEALGSLIDRGWMKVEIMFGNIKTKRHSKQEIQDHFNAMLNVIPMTKVKKNDKT
tara:strand:- start:89 stop:337 length:249 start_codon:yes stop_codon:yes gene_type:complete